MREDIKIADYDYHLPEDRIARFPLAQRDGSRLLVWKDGEICESLFSQIAEELPPHSFLVFNDTRVVRARLVMHRASGARIEIFCLEPLEPVDYERAFAVTGECRWACMAGNLKKWKEPLGISFEYDGGTYTLQASRGEPLEGGALAVDFSWDAPFAFGQLLELLGRTPIPPYLGRESDQQDTTRYQTVYARIEGSVAAPTAGLHFSGRLMEELHGRGVGMQSVTLHVGAGTFLPVKCESASDHTMHTEHFSVTMPALKALRDRKGALAAVGTTTVRTLESLTVLGWRITCTGDPDIECRVGQWEAYDIPCDFDASRALMELIGYMERNGLEVMHAATRIMIAPGFMFRFTDILVTNFHQPQSTLLLLVSAFTAGRWREIYDYALENGFRFLSYGDSSLLWRADISQR